MKTRIIVLPLLLLWLILTVQSCKKDNEPSRMDLLTARPWRMVSGVVTDASGTESDVYSGLRACERDNEFVFKSDLVHEHTEGATKCNPSDPQVVYFASWKFLNNESVIEISAGSEKLEYRIISLTATEFLFDVIYGSLTQHIRMIH
ncbi:MAG: hypothetical protein J7527_19180 [Chitinophagaceae bacterium]|nr:hypothetical protein [Chitinophagaceae bacterium]